MFPSILFPINLYQSVKLVISCKSRSASLFHLFLFSSLIFCVSGANADTYRIGVLAYRGESQAMQAWSATGDYLNKTLAPHTFEIIPFDIAKMELAVANKEIDFAITQATQFVGLEIRLGISRIATIKRHYQGDDFTRYGAVIITKADRETINEIGDLKNKVFAAIDEFALGGWQMAALEMDRENAQPSQIKYMGFPQSNVVFAVRDGLADAGTVRSRIFYELIDKGMIDFADYKIVGPRSTLGYPFVHSTNLYPEWPIAKLSHTSKALSKSVVNALLALESDHPAARNANISGWTVPLDYKPIYSLMQQLKIGPFEQKDEAGLSELSKNTWLVASVLLLGFFMYFLIRFRQPSHSREKMGSPQKHVKFEDALRSTYFSAPLEVMDSAILIVNLSDEIIFSNSSAQQVLNTKATDLLGKPLGSVIQFESEESFTQQHFNLPTRVIARVSKRDGELCKINVIAKKLDDSNGNLEAVLLELDNSAQAVNLEQKIIYLASHDALTGLLNRNEFENLLNQELGDSEQRENLSTLLYLDLDQFKLVNDACGHIAGDELLQQVAEKIENNTKHGEVIARISGDEFAILLRDCDLSQAVIISERIRNALDQIRFAWGEKVFDVAVSIGVLAITDEYKTVMEVFSAADAACYAAKSSGRNRIHIYAEDDNIIQKRRNEVQWAQELKYALENDMFDLVCQPILSLKNQNVHSWYLEVLIRMRDRQGNNVMPMAFIPAAERYHQMVLVDKWVVSNTVKCLMSLEPMQLENVRCFINISGQTLSDMSFLSFVSNLLSETNLNPACLCFEITETATIANFKQAINLISVLQRLGCHFALDDFGTGLSSFSYLKQLPVDYIKIDGSFIRNMGKDPVAKAIVDSISTICHTMNIEAIAEFVESESILSNVKSINLDYIQGYMVGKPLPLDVMLENIQVEQKGLLDPRFS